VLIRESGERACKRPSPPARLGMQRKEQGGGAVRLM
jgi:hypothetical protein